MHGMYPIDLMRQRDERVAARAARRGLHLAALRAVCVRAPGLRGLLGACAAS